MKINNVSSETSYQSLIVMSIITFIMTAIFVCGYISSAFTQISFLGFFEWLYDMFMSMKDAMADEPFLPWLILVCILGVYIGFIITVISKYTAKTRFNSEFNVKYIDFLPEGIGFFFTKPEYNFKCSYCDIENLHMDIQSTLVHTKNGSYVAFKQMNLAFKVLNGKTFRLSNTTTAPMSLIYKIIDWTRGVQKFEYGFSGYGEVPDYKEKIDNYIQFGYRDIVGKDGELKFKMLSILFFMIGIFMMFAFLDTPADIIEHPMMLFVYCPFFIFIIISFIFDIILVVDAIRDKKYRGYNG